MALSAMCRYFGILTPSLSREVPTVLANSFPVEFSSCIITSIPPMDVVIIIQSWCSPHFSRTPFNIAREWSDSGTNCHRQLVCWSKHWQFGIELCWCCQLSFLMVEIVFQLGHLMQLLPKLGSIAMSQFGEHTHGVLFQAGCVGVCHPHIFAWPDGQVLHRNFWWRLGSRLVCRLNQVMHFTTTSRC